MGNCRAGRRQDEPRPPGRHRRRVAGLGSGETVNRVCGSAAQAIVSAAQDIIIGSSTAAVARRLEKMDLAPLLIARGRWGYPHGRRRALRQHAARRLNDAFSDEASAGTRKTSSASSRSAARAGPVGAALAATVRAAQAAAGFKDEIVPIPSWAAARVRRPSRPTSTKAPHDARYAGGVEARLPRRRHHHAANAPGLNSGGGDGDDGGETGRRRAASSRWRVSSPGHRGGRARDVRLGPIPAVRQALERAGWRAAEIERVEINEASRHRDRRGARARFPRDIVNVEGGAIAHGTRSARPGPCSHPPRPFDAARWNQRGLVTLCIGGGPRDSTRLETIP